MGFCPVGFCPRTAGRILSLGGDMSGVRPLVRLGAVLAQ